MPVAGLLDRKNVCRHGGVGDHKDRLYPGSQIERGLPDLACATDRHFHQLQAQPGCGFTQLPGLQRRTGLGRVVQGAPGAGLRHQPGVGLELQPHRPAVAHPGQLGSGHLAGFASLGHDAGTDRIGHRRKHHRHPRARLHRSQGWRRSHAVDQVHLVLDELLHDRLGPIRIAAGGLDVVAHVDPGLEAGTRKRGLEALLVHVQHRHRRRADDPDSHRPGALGVRGQPQQQQAQAQAHRAAVDGFL